MHKKLHSICAFSFIFSTCLGLVLGGYAEVPLECPSSSLINFQNVLAPSSLIGHFSNKELSSPNRSASRISSDPGDVPARRHEEKYSLDSHPPKKNNLELYAKSVAFKKYFDMLPLLNNKSSDRISELCRRHISVYLQDLKALKLWALRLYDSTAKLTSGVLNGNINQYGDFDQCLKINTEAENGIRGKYCLVSLQITIKSNASQELKDIYELTHAYHTIRSSLSDPGHRIPRFSSISWGVCVPNSCTPADVKIIMESTLEEYVNTSVADVEVQMNSEMCQEKNNNDFSKWSVIVIGLFVSVVLLVIYATVYDNNVKMQRNEILLSFSLKKTIGSLISLKRADDDIKAVHGIRCLNAVLLIFAHKSMAALFYPYINRTEMSERIGEYWTVIGRAASLYTDPFIMFSGLLTCYSLMRDFETNKKVSIWKEYLGRLFRLVPNLSALILYCTWILPVIGSGPQWPLVVEHHSDICKVYWWRNFIFMHNYFGFENMCLTHTHHIGIDTQLFIIGVPMIIWMGTRKQDYKKILMSCVLLAVVSTIARFYVSYTMELSNYVHFGATIQQLFKTADYMYILPPYRFTVYAMGIILAILLRHPLKKPLTKNLLTLGWVTSALLFCMAFFGQLEMGSLGYKYNAFHNALYAAFGPIAWCFAFGWIIYTSHHGYNSYIGDIFSWRCFIIWTRISYAVYLTQFPIFFYFVGLTRGPIQYTILSSYLNTNELLLILATSVIMTLIFDLPFQNLKKIIFRIHKKKEEVNHNCFSKVISENYSQSKELNDKID